MAAGKYKIGDYIEKKGKVSGLWFPGVVLRVEGDNIIIKTWGWDDEMEVTSDILRPLTSDNVVTIRANGSVWAEVDEGGAIRINGSIVGSISSEEGTIYKNGSIVGSISFNGVLYKNGSEVGSIWPSGELYREGSIIGEISNSDGTIRLSGSIWGNIDNFSYKWRDLRYTSAVLAFFAPEFGY
ncbi:MAG TPA: hypothetical protein PLE45_12520 [Spirochaetota bacterium]|nr:hypothetical protein [Spirochaetota bacterium]HOL56695.1 hypothetical protein [Spirochaetota bacterium]HPP05565.1 hypothetical protein [Spirochaetota bacterium]